MNKDIYLASPLFCDEDNEVLDKIESALDELGISYFSPRHDSKLDLRSAKTQHEKDKIAQDIFNLNESAILGSSLILANVIGTRYNNAIYSDAGTMIEVGMSIAHDIPIISYTFRGYGLNIMMSQKVVRHLDNLTMDEGQDDIIEKLSFLPTILSDINNGLGSDELRDKWFDKDNEMELV